MAPSTWKVGQLSSLPTVNSAQASAKACAATAQAASTTVQQQQQPAVQHVCQHVPRPAAAHATQDAGFTLEDDALATFAEQLLSGCWCASVPGLPGQPLAAVSPALEQLAGQAAADLLGNSSQKLQQTLRLEPQAADELAAARAAGGLALVELSASVKCGRRKNFAVCLVPLALSSRAVQLLLEFWLDLDEQWADAADSAGVKKLAAQVWRAAEAGIISGTSQQGTANITACSTSAYSLTGYSELDLAGCSVLCLAGPETSNSSMRHLMAAQLSGRHASMKMLLYKQDGSPFWAMAATCPLATWKHGAAPNFKVATAGSGQRQHQRHQQPGSSNSVDCNSSSSSSSNSSSSPTTAQLLLLVDITSSHAKRVGKYMLGRVLGAGASGVVRIAKHTATDELVAIKAVDATRFRSISEIEQVQDEMAVLAQMRHPNIIRLHEVVFAGGCFYFVMEYASGGSLAGHMAGQPGARLCEAAAKEVFGSILAALEYCHKRRVIHRDLKPENILMEGGTPKIADFGLAGVVAPFNGAGFKLQCGTPEFTAPEIVGGGEYEGTAVDLWSVGVMLYEALSGQLPFKGSSQSALFRSIRRGAYAPLPKTISADARDLVKRLLTVDPAARITWDQLSRHPWLGRQAAQQRNRTSSCSGAACSSDGAVCGSISGEGCQIGTSSASSHILSSHTSEMGSWDGNRLLADGSTTQAALSSSSSCVGSAHEGCRRSLPPSIEGGHAAGQALDTSCGMQPHRSAVSFTSTSCHDSVRVVIAESSRDDPIAAAIKRLAGAGTISSLQSSEEAKHIYRELAPSCAAIKTNSSHGLSSRGLSSPCLASPVRGERPNKTPDS